jgi:hypothetical protein
MITKEAIDQAQEAIKKNPVNPDIKDKLLFIMYAQAFANGAKSMINKWEEIMGPYQDQYRSHSGDTNKPITAKEGY